METDDRPETIRVLRVYHAGRDFEQRARERALAASGVQLDLVVPAAWIGAESRTPIAESAYRVIELPVKRPGDVNRHAYVETKRLARLMSELRPDLLDLHEEPFSIAARQWLLAAPRQLPVVMYTAQNIDKRLPPPFALYERFAFRRVAALYPCSAQAASVARGKGFTGHIEVLPLGYDDAIFGAGSQTMEDDEIVLALFGRLVPEKGVLDAVRVLATVQATRQSRLQLVGQGPEARAALELAASLGVADRVEILPWQPAKELAAICRRTHVVLVPSQPTETWAEQFGRVIVEAQASGAVVAGYRSGSIHEVAGEPAILVDVGRVDDLAREVAALVRDPAAFGSRREQGLKQTRPAAWAEIGRRHADVYRRTVAGEFTRTRLSHSPRRRRVAAQGEFGPTAEAIGGRRPFAIPVLRRMGRATRGLAAAVDGVTEAIARLHHS